jgi:hypothetical protein
MCWNHSLYDAIIYVYNRGMNDYTTPLEQLLSQLGAAVNRGKQLTGILDTNFFFFPLLTLDQI